MLQRKFTTVLEQFLTEKQNKILLVNGARQIVKYYSKPLGNKTNTLVFLDEIQSYLKEEALDEHTHNLLLKRFQYYLLVGGLPDAINRYLEDRNMVRVRKVHKDIHELYRIDASQYDEEHKLKIPKIPQRLIPSSYQNWKHYN
ncbi:MAG: hypothetical protein IJ767_00995 [Bacteroidaceae bacterium]|nr:hypothetical protein [Bacteroidaceae bacterium]